MRITLLAVLALGALLVASADDARAAPATPIPAPAVSADVYVGFGWGCDPYPGPYTRTWYRGYHPSYPSYHHPVRYRTYHSPYVYRPYYRTYHRGPAYYHRPSVHFGWRGYSHGHHGHTRHVRGVRR